MKDLLSDVDQSTEEKEQLLNDIDIQEDSMTEQSDGKLQTTCCVTEENTDTLSYSIVNSFKV